MALPARSLAQVPSYVADEARPDARRDALETAAMMGYRRRVRIVLEAAVASQGFRRVEASYAALGENTVTTPALAVGVRYGPLPWVDLRVTLGVAAPTEVHFDRLNESFRRCAERGQRSRSSDPSGALLDLAMTARLRPAPLTPIYLGLGADVVLHVFGGPTRAFCDEPGPTFMEAASFVWDAPLRVVPYLGGRVEAGFHFGRRELLDLGRRVRFLSSLGQVQNGALYTYAEAYFGAAFY
jgi:hypothetical protein